MCPGNIEEESLKKQRCKQAGTDPFYIEYHNNEWGISLHDDRKLFELLILEGMQAGGMVNDHTIDCFRYHEIQGV